MKRILFSLLLSLPISMVAMDTFERRQDGYERGHGERQAYRKEKLELKRNAQCVNEVTALTPAGSTDYDLAMKVCHAYRGKTGKNSTCSLLCQYNIHLRRYNFKPDQPQ